MTITDNVRLQSIDYSDEFIQMYDRCSKKLYMTALMLLKNTNDAEDVVQDTVLLAMKAFSSLKNRDSFEPWILKILVNRCKRFRLLQFKFNFIDPSLDKVWEDAVSDDSIIISNALLKLSYKYRIVVTLRFFDDLTINQISEILKLPEGTIKSQLHRALKQLKSILEGDM